jgi:hypothetical protein
MAAVVDMKQRNPSWGSPRIAHQLTLAFGLPVFDQAKSAEVSYSQVRRKAERLWPLWTYSIAERSQQKKHLAGTAWET